MNFPWISRTILYVFLGTHLISQDLISEVFDLDDKSLILNDGIVITMTGKIIENASILIENGRIKFVGKMQCPSNDKTVIDISGKYVVPGFILMNSSICLDNKQYLTAYHSLNSGSRELDIIRKLGFTRINLSYTESIPHATSLIASDLSEEYLAYISGFSGSIGQLSVEEKQWFKRMEEIGSYQTRKPYFVTNALISDNTIKSITPPIVVLLENFDNLNFGNLPVLVSPIHSNLSENRYYKQMTEVLQSRSTKAFYFPKNCYPNAYTLRHMFIDFGFIATAGLPQIEILKMLTIYPARILGIDADFGTIEAGKVADLVVFSEHPFSMNSQPDLVFIGGKIVN